MFLLNRLKLSCYLRLNRTYLTQLFHGDTGKDNYATFIFVQQYKLCSCKLDWRVVRESTPLLEIQRGVNHSGLTLGASSLGEQTAQGSDPTLATCCGRGLNM